MMTVVLSKVKGSGQECPLYTRARRALPGGQPRACPERSRRGGCPPTVQVRASETSLGLVTLMVRMAAIQAGRDGYVQSFGSHGGNDLDGAGGDGCLPGWERIKRGGTGSGSRRGEGYGSGEADGGGGGGMLLGNPGGVSACEGRDQRDLGIRGRFGEDGRL